MTAETLAPPVAAATILNVFLFALAWRATQEEKRRGEAPWSLTIGLLAYAVSLCAYGYSALGRPLAGAVDYFAVTLIGEALGASVVYALLHAFVLTRSQPIKNRAFPMILAVLMLGAMFASLVSG